MAAPVAAARLRCSYSADERDDPLPGTAAHAMGYLLIEAPGAWGQNALSESRLDPEIANLVAARAAELSYRVLLIKRPGRAAVEPRRAWVVVSSTPGAESTTWGSYASRPASDMSIGERNAGVACATAGANQAAASVKTRACQCAATQNFFKTPEPPARIPRASVAIVTAEGCVGSQRSPRCVRHA